MERIAVIGAGIAGLSTAHALTATATATATSSSSLVVPTVHCFDARPGLDKNQGAGIQLNGGLAVLGQINTTVQRAVMDAGLPAVGVRSRAKAWSNSSSNSHDKPFETLLELDLLSTVRRAGGAVAAALIHNDKNNNNNKDQLLWYSIMRGALQETLYETLPQETRQRVAFDKTLTDIIPASSNTDNDGTGAMLHFADGTVAGPFDLVIGCDGIKSAVKEYVEQGKIAKNAAEREGAAAALYSGVRIRYAVKDGTAAEPQAESATLSQFFGDGAYALDGTYGNGAGKPNTKSSFVVYLDEGYIGPFKKSNPNSNTANGPVIGENADWTQNVQKAVESTRETMLKQVQDSGIPDKDLAPTIMNADRFFDLGVYFHNPFSLAGWSKEIADSGGAVAVLCGDAAHAMPPFLGQGSNQAIQDAYCLATKILEYNKQVRRGDLDVTELKELFKQYEKTRWPVAFAITWKAAFLGYLETGGQNGMYSKFRDVFFKTMGAVGVAEKVLLGAATPKV